MLGKHGTNAPLVGAIWRRLFIGLCALCVAAFGAICVYKFTDIRYVLEGGYSYDTNAWYEPYVSQARDLSQVTDCDVAMVGDSLTLYGLWGEFFPDLTLVNRGIGSDVTAGVLNRLDTVVAVKPEKVFLMIGTNDVAKRVDGAETISNMAQILDGLEAELPDAEIYVESVLPRTAKYSAEVEALNEGYKALCSGRDGITFIDMYASYLGADGKPNAELFASDGYHMSGKGYSLWVEKIRGYVYGTN